MALSHGMPSGTQDMPPAILLLGPTASGKTALALHLADHFPVEIISVDSALVYRDMNVGTAKPDAATLKLYPHHLIDLIAPTEAYSAAQFCDDARAEMAKITARGRVPILVGGTMLYIKALLEGLSSLPRADARLRMDLEARARRIGWPAMHRELALVDPAMAMRLNPADSQRIQRALEVSQLTGKPLSELQIRSGQPSGFPYRTLQIGLIPADRAVLHERIAQRFSAMLDAGLVDEVRQLRDCYSLSPDLPSMRCVGYRQAWAFIEGDIDEPALRTKGIAATRQLAKRQMTWLRAMPEMESFDCFRGDLAKEVSDRCAAFLDNK